jgi:glycerol-3-phosphate acyltransferase PlsY
MTLLALLVSAATAYLLGSFPSGVVVVRFWTGNDLREMGTGHTGGRNVRRVAGLGPAILAVLGDAAKALVAVKLAELFGPAPWAVPVAATAAVAGHCWPLYTRFQGGMGLGCASFILLYLSPLSFFLLVPAFLVWYLLSRQQYRAAAATALTAPVSLWLTGNPWPAIAAGIGMGVVVAVRHIPNLKSTRPPRSTRERDQ